MGDRNAELKLTYNQLVEEVSKHILLELLNGSLKNGAHTAVQLVVSWCAQKEKAEKHE